MARHLTHRAAWIAGKPAPTSAYACRECSVDANPVGARLAGEGDFTGAIAGKPCSYGCVGVPGMFG